MTQRGSAWRDLARLRRAWLGKPPISSAGPSRERMLLNWDDIRPGEAISEADARLSRWRERARVREQLEESRRSDAQIRAVHLGLGIVLVLVLPAVWAAPLLVDRQGGLRTTGNAAAGNIL